MSIKLLLLKWLMNSYMDEDLRNTMILIAVFIAVFIVFFPALIVCIIVTSIASLEMIFGGLLGFISNDELMALELLQEEYAYIQYDAINITNTSLLELTDLYPVTFDPEESWGSPTFLDWTTYRVTDEFGRRSIHPVTLLPGAMHTGLDLAVSIGTSITTVRSGRIIRIAYSDSGYGVQIAVDHGNGYITLYAHLNRVLVSEGDYVHQGDIIAESGNTGRSTGPHLHIEFMINGVPQNPREFLP